MKHKLQLFLFVLLSNIAYSQNVQIASDFDWEVGLSQNGSFDIVPLGGGNCVDELHIDDICGASYASPALEDHFSTCKDFEVIWGSAAPESCYYQAETFWFKKTFILTEAVTDNLIDGFAKIQGDNRFTFYMNGTELGSSAPNQWDTAIDYEVTNHLIEGENEILVEVENLNGGTCFNYAFFAFCLDINYSFYSSNEEIPDVDSYMDIFPNPTSDYINIISKTSSDIQNLNIYSIDGRKYFTERTSIQEELTIPVGHWHNGIYIVEFEVDGLIFHKRVVISKN